VLYVVQENAEARAMGVNLHGLRVLTGVHQWAPLVQLCVATVGASALWMLRRPVTRLARTVRAVAAAFLRLRRPGLTRQTTVPTTRTWSPEARWGALRWCRPPPLAAIPA
jgi:hypothetical protein